MFSGLVEDIGRVEELKPVSSGAKLTIKSSLSELKIGDSISVNGACLTLTSLNKNFLSFDLSQETLNRSNLRFLKKGDWVNLERALKVGDRIGGHFLQGHVDFTSRIESFFKKGSHWELKISVPKDYLEYVVEKGSIGVDGISLTVNSIKDGVVSINIIPHTYEHTNLKYRNVGDFVNVELDILGKYVINYIKLMKRERRFEELFERFLG